VITEHLQITITQRSLTAVDGAGELTAAEHQVLQRRVAEAAKLVLWQPLPEVLPPGPRCRCRGLLHTCGTVT